MFALPNVHNILCACVHHTGFLQPLAPGNQYVLYKVVTGALCRAGLFRAEPCVMINKQPPPSACLAFGRGVRDSSVRRRNSYRRNVCKEKTIPRLSTKLGKGPQTTKIAYVQRIWGRPDSELEEKNTSTSFSSQEERGR